MRSRITNQMFAGVFGGTYVLIGLLGFAVTAGVGLSATQGNNLLVFELNPLHNVVHLAIGALFLTGAALGESAARTVNIGIGSTYLVVGLIGLFLVNSGANILALNHPDNVLHLGSAVAALIVAAKPMAATRSSARPSRAA